METGGVLSLLSTPTLCSLMLSGFLWWICFPAFSFFNFLWLLVSSYIDIQTATKNKNVFLLLGGSICFYYDRLISFGQATLSILRNYLSEIFNA